MTRRMKLEGVVLSEGSQKEKDKYWRISCVQKARKESVSSEGMFAEDPESVE